MSDAGIAKMAAGASAALLTEEEVPRPPQPRRLLWTGSDLLQASFADPVWVVPGLIPEGLTILAGRPKLGKSWFALQVACAKACGGLALGRQVAGGPVMYFALEDGARRLQSRMREQEWPGQAADNTVFVLASSLDDLLRRVSEAPPALCVIDTFSKLMLGSGMDHDDAGRQTDVWGKLHNLTQETPAALFVLEHHKKAFSVDGVSDILGSTAKGAIADTIIGLYRERGKRDAKLLVTGRDVEDEELLVRFDAATAAWQPVDSHTGLKHEPAILEALRVRPNTISGLSRDLGISKSRVSETLAELRHRGVVEADGSGVCRCV